MGQIITTPNTNWPAELQDKAAMILFTDGQGIRSDCNATFKKSATETDNITFLILNPADNAAFAGQFDVNDKPVMVAWYKGEILARRSRPWGSDVTLAIDQLKNRIKEDTPKTENPEEQKSMANVANDKPVNVTDTTFQAEVVDFSDELPVIVDFWAEWCGPCRMVAPIMEKLAKEYAGKIRVAKVDVDSNPGLSQTFQVRSIPTIMAFKERHMVFAQPGAFPEAAFRDLIEQLIALEIPAEDTAPENAN